MIYLISQIIMALLVAVILGTAIGWLIHRASYDKEIHKLRQAIGKQNAQLSQAKSDVAMLNDDFDDLQQQSQEQIVALREENQQIPPLKSNLEKSQLLVRQMMQRHETSMRELGRERDSLLKRMSESNPKNTVPDPALHLSEPVVAPARQSKSSADEPGQIDHNRSWLGDGKSLVPDQEEIDADATPYDEVIEIADTLQRELKLELNADTSQEISQASMTVTEPVIATETASIKPAVPTKPAPISPGETVAESAEDSSHASDQESTQPLEYEPADKMEAAANHNLISTSDHISTEIPSEVAYPLESNSEQSAVYAKMSIPDILLDKTGTNSEATLRQGQIDGSQDTASLFGPVNQHDDLQQIFGIGPLTEKALNELGITSYSQLARLNEHEIQKIADALDIGSARIERDNWVGNARRQLEEVLEQL